MKWSSSSIGDSIHFSPCLVQRHIQRQSFTSESKIRLEDHSSTTEGHVAEKDGHLQHLQQKENNMEVTRPGCIVQASVTSVISLTGISAP